MDESESKKENNKKERQFDPELLKKGLRCDREQYERLTEEGVETWNKWRLGHTGEDILLEGANLSGRDLKGVYLKHWFKGEVYLKGANFYNAHLEGALLTKVHLEGANLRSAYLQMAEFTDARLQGTILSRSHLEGANFETAIVDGSTAIWKPSIDRQTNFCGVALDIVRIDPGTKQLLEYNIRRKNWEDWYKVHPKMKWLVQSFWWVSDYGFSTGRIIVTFSALAFIFANIYYHWGRIAPPGIVENLFVDRNGIVVPSWLVPLRTLYFSIVTMTTLGFGDMYANAQSIWGHILLSLQVILGYVLLGALVTRFAVLFMAGGPAGKFADEQEKKKS